VQVQAGTLVLSSHDQALSSQLEQEMTGAVVSTWVTVVEAVAVLPQLSSCDQEITCLNSLPIKGKVSAGEADVEPEAWQSVQLKSPRAGAVQSLLVESVGIESNSGKPSSVTITVPEYVLVWLELESDTVQEKILEYASSQEPAAVATLWTTDRSSEQSSVKVAVMSVGLDLQVMV
jgi:hypothetical protein